MNIEGLDYNTRREYLVLPEYGREIQRMVAHALTIKHRPLRQRCAHTIVRTMQRVVPPLSNSRETQQKYWDHLAILSDYRLDIDYPFATPSPQALSAPPQRLAYHRRTSAAGQYGLLLARTIERLRTLPAGPDRDRLARRTALQMSRCLQQYSQTVSSEEKVLADLAVATDNAVVLTPQSLHSSHGYGGALGDKHKKGHPKPIKRHTK